MRLPGTRCQKTYTEFKIREAAEKCDEKTEGNVTISAAFSVSL